MRPEPGTIDPESPYPLFQCKQCLKMAHVQKVEGKEGFWLSCDCEKAQPWQWIPTRGNQRLHHKLDELKRDGIWTNERDVPRDECGTPLVVDDGEYLERG